MNVSHDFDEYTEKVCEQIRWEKSHPMITKELLGHLEDQKEDFISYGYSESVAVEKALEQIGDPIPVGLELDLTHKSKPQWQFFIFIALLLGIGIFVRSAMFLAKDSFFISPDTLTAQIGTLLLATVCLLIPYFFDFTILGKYPKIIYFSTIVLSLLMIAFVPRMNMRVIFMTEFSFLFPLVYAGMVYSLGSMRQLGFVLSGFSLGILLLVTTRIPNFSSLIVLLITGVITLVIAVKRNWFGVDKTSNTVWLFGILFCFVAIILFIIAISQPRWEVLLNPYLDPEGAGYMTLTTRKFLKGAKLFGRGASYRVGVNAPLILPEIHSERILTYIIYRFGWVPFVVLMGIFTVFLVKAFFLSLKQKSALGKFVSTAIVTTFALQIFFYVLSNLGFGAITFSALPLISYSRAALYIHMALLGILLSVFRTGHVVQDSISMSKGQHHPFIEHKNGKLIITLNWKDQ